jgi:uncharacterized protein YqeY
MTQHPKEALNDALKEAMKAKDNARRDALRLLTSAIKQAEVDSQKELTADAAMDVLQREAKKRRENIAEYEKLGRAEQVQSEQYELSVIEEFLPRQLTHDEIVAIVKEVIASTGVTSAKEMGKLMGALQPRVKGVADGKVVSEIVKSLLS